MDHADINAALTETQLASHDLHVAAQHVTNAVIARREFDVFSKTAPPTDSNPQKARELAQAHMARIAEQQYDLGQMQSSGKDALDKARARLDAAITAFAKLSG